MTRSPDRRHIGLVKAAWAIQEAEPEAALDHALVGSRPDGR